MPSNTHMAETLFTDYGDFLRGYVRERVPGRERAHAEDIVQEVFVKVIRHLRKGGDISKPRGFLCTAARNLITSTFYRGQACETDTWENMDDYSSTQSPSRDAGNQQELDALCAAIAAVPDRYQEAFVRRRIWGESCSEIAEAMCLSESAASNYATLGWKAIQEALEVER